MGIPSFFSYILKNHPDIIKKLNIKINNLYLDSNSIIYDSLRLLEEHHDFEQKLIEKVALKIDEYINIVNPTHTVMVAFDGVAPVAKLEQQRNRRYKSALEKEVFSTFTNTNEKKWDQAAITPGTTFMKHLGTYISNYFKKNNKIKIIVSTSEDVGEGEHKIFKYIRENAEFHKKTTSLIYGLDADLIMLALNHLPISKNIYLFRETPEFVRSVNSDLSPNETYMLDIPLLANSIIFTLNNYKPPNTLQQKNRLYDYIFLGFFLGNDFMPHFPSINIRTNGISIMLTAYQKTIGNTNKNITDGKTIYWGQVRKLVEFLASDEEDNLKREYYIRNKWEKRHFPCKTLEEKQKRYVHIPIKNRRLELSIDPFKKGWQQRYYKSLFNIDVTKEWKEKICLNYLEGLEWTMHYYTSDCKDWRWCYKFHYPPLLNDLIQYIPHWETDMIEKNNHKAVIPYVQLSYVLPKRSLHLLPSKIYKKLMKEKSYLYATDCFIYWAFCKYFWESHVELPSIHLSEFEAYIENIVI